MPWAPMHVNRYRRVFLYLISRCMGRTDIFVSWASNEPIDTKIWGLASQVRLPSHRILSTVHVDLGLRAEVETGNQVE